MQNQFKVLTLSYKQAPIATREAVALNEIGCRNLLDKIKEFTSAADVLVLSTCNRTEVYYTSETDLTQELIKLIAIEKGFIATKSIKPYFLSINDHLEAVKHLFNVALGLESQVMGDMQIMNQVKNAYKLSIDAGMAGPFLHRLLHTIFNTNKQVVNETAFRSGTASVSYATVELVEELTSTLDNPRVLVIGVGDIGKDVCLNFQKSSIDNVVLVNRTYHKAQDLSERIGAKAVYWENVWQEIELADVVISAVPGDCFFIPKAKVAAMNVQTVKFFIDLSMPRSIDVELEKLPAACVYNIDNIRNRTSEALKKRLAAIPEVQQLVAEAVEEFSTWAKEMAMSPALQLFKSRLEEIRQQEVARHLKKLGSEENELIEAITKNILNKIVKIPALELKAACQRGNAEALLDSLHILFDLETEKA